MLVHSCVVKSYVIDSVYLADSLFLPTEVKQHKLGKKPSNIVVFGDRVVDIPESLVTNPDLLTWLSLRVLKLPPITRRSAEKASFALRSSWTKKLIYSMNMQIGKIFSIHCGSLPRDLRLSSKSARTRFGDSSSATLQAGNVHVAVRHYSRQSAVAGLPLHF